VSRPYATNVLRNRPVAVVSASTTPFGGVWAAAELRKVLARTGARVLEDGVAVFSAEKAFGPDGRLIDHELDKALAAAVGALARECQPAELPTG
jgi:chromate reductase